MFTFEGRVLSQDQACSTIACNAMLACWHWVMSVAGVHSVLCIRLRKHPQADHGSKDSEEAMHPNVSICSGLITCVVHKCSEHALNMGLHTDSSQPTCLRSLTALAKSCIFWKVMPRSVWHSALASVSGVRSMACCRSCTAHYTA